MTIDTAALRSQARDAGGNFPIITAARLIEIADEIDRLRTALAFAATQIKAGLPWTPECEEMIASLLAGKGGESMSASFATKTMKDGTRWHSCMACGYEWPARDRWLWWPVKMRYVRREKRYGRYWPPKRWGVEVGTDALWRRTIQRIYGVLGLRIICGCDRFGRPDARACPRCGAVGWRKDAGSVAPSVRRWELWRIEAIWRARYSRESYDGAMASFRNVFRKWQETEEAVKVVTDATTARAVHDLVRRKEEAAEISGLSPRGGAGGEEGESGIR